MATSRVKADKKLQGRIKDYEKNLAGKRGFRKPGSMKK